MHSATHLPIPKKSSQYPKIDSFPSLPQHQWTRHPYETLYTSPANTRNRDHSPGGERSLSLELTSAKRIRRGVSANFHQLKAARSSLIRRHAQHTLVAQQQWAAGKQARTFAARHRAGGVAISIDRGESSNDLAYYVCTCACLCVRPSLHAPDRHMCCCGYYSRASSALRVIWIGRRRFGCHAAGAVWVWWDAGARARCWGWCDGSECWYAAGLCIARGEVWLGGWCVLRTLLSFSWRGLVWTIDFQADRSGLKLFFFYFVYVNIFLFTGSSVSRELFWNSFFNDSAR